MQIKIIEQESGVHQVILPDGTTTTDTDIEYAITKNGFYKFTAYDNAGNVSQEFVIEASNINENTNMDEIEDIIDEVVKELEGLVNGEDKYKLEKQLNKLKEDYDTEIKSRIDFISESIKNMVSKGEEETIVYEIGNLPEKYQSNKYTPSLEEEKARLNQELQDKINQLMNKNEFDIAKDLVEKAEKTLNQEDLNNARDKVNILNNETQKNDLNDRLDIVQEVINKIKDIEKEIKDMDGLDDKNHIQNEIDKLPNGKEKDRLQQELNDKIEELEALNSGNKTLSEAIEAVKRAERTLQQIDLDSAWVKVKLLPEGNDRNELSDRLNIVQELIFAIKQIEKDIYYMKTLEIESWIQREIDRLPNVTEKDRLQKELDIRVRELQKLENINKDFKQATEAVERAEQTITQKNVDRAWILVNRLSNTREKDNLISRLDKVQELIDSKEEEGKDLEEAIKAVERVELTLQQKDLESARIKVDRLPESIIKESLNKRLDLVQKIINGEIEKKEEANEKLLEEVLEAVKKAEVTIKHEDIKNAKDKISQLSDGSMKEIFKERIELVEKIRIFKDELEKQEKEKKEENKTKEPEPEKPQSEKPQSEKPQVQEPKPDKPITTPSVPSTTSKPSTSQPSIIQGSNNSSNSNSNSSPVIGVEIETKIEEEEEFIDNSYYKKPVRDKQENFFKLKEPIFLAKDEESEDEGTSQYDEIDEYDGIDDYEETEEKVLEVDEIKAKPKKSKLPIIIIGILFIAGTGIGMTLFIKNKNKEDEEESYD